MAEAPTAIGVYDGEHCGSFHVQVALEYMELPYNVFSDADVPEPGFGEDLSVLIFGAGHVSESPAALGGAAGRQRIRDLVSEGRLYIGACAGAYLAVYAEPVGLALARCELDCGEGGNTFQGFLTVEYPCRSGKLFPVWVQNGPVFSRDEGGVLARFAERRVSDAQASRRVSSLVASDFADRPAAVAGAYGRGRYILLSPHPELGSLGIPGLVSLASSWMRENCSEEYGAHPNRVPMGKTRRRFLDHVGELGLGAQLQGPQWRMLRELIEMGGPGGGMR